MTVIYRANRSSPVVLPVVHDPEAEEYYTCVYRPLPWVNETVYYEKSGSSETGSIVAPTTSSGFLQECTSGGVSGTLEPTWGTANLVTTSDGTCTWKAIPDDSYLRSGDTIQASEWSGSAGVVLADDGISATTTYVKVTAVSSTAKYILLTNRITTLRSNGRTEIIERTIKVKVKQQ